MNAETQTDSLPPSCSFCLCGGSIRLIGGGPLDQVLVDHWESAHRALGHELCTAGQAKAVRNMKRGKRVSTFDPAKAFLRERNRIEVQRRRKELAERDQHPA